MLKEIIPTNRITYKDTESYFGVLLDGNVRKWVCRLSIGESQSCIHIPDESKKGIRYTLISLDDIYNYKDKLIEVAKRYS